MSKIAVISDIHANIDALNLVLNSIEKKNVDKIFCLGDLITKYFYPSEVVDSIKENCEIIIKGNCDELVTTNQNYKFARGKLGLDRLDFLSNLPLFYTINQNDLKINFYHSSPHSLDKIFNPLFDGNKYTDYKDKIIYDYHEMFDDNNISIVAHTHQSYIAVEEDDKLNIIDDKVMINNKHIILNVGSAGEHSHMILTNLKSDTIIDPYLTYAIIDNYSSLEIIKVPYREVLKKVYFDFVKAQNDKLVPYSPQDTKKLRKSLRLMC